jgi:hypothetical protein
MKKSTISSRREVATSRVFNANSVLLAGDTHADWTWLDRVVLATAARLGLPAVIVVGDFGYWARHPEFLNVARNSTANHGVETWFLDGNHEQHDLLSTDVREARTSGSGLLDPVNVGGSLWYLPRGCRLTIGGQRVACLGGAVSIDRGERIEGDSWFAAEAVTEADLQALISGGPADVLLTHDAPSGWEPPGLALDRDLPLRRQAMLPAIADHRRLLRRGYEALQPKLLVHGHYHISYDEFVGETWDDVRVVGLNCNGTQRSLRVLGGGAAGPELGPWVDPWAGFSA